MVNHSLAQAGLADLDASWIPSVEPSLLAAAKRSQVGRHWIASVLAESWDLFNDLTVYSDELQPPQLPPWLFTNLPGRAPLVLGALTFAGAIKKSVARAQVSRLREILGLQLHQRILDEPDSPETAPSSVAQQDINTAIQVGAPRELATRFRRQGAMELYHSARHYHPRAGERVALAFPRDWQLDQAHRHLPESKVAEVLEGKFDPTLIADPVENVQGGSP